MKPFSNSPSHRVLAAGFAPARSATLGGPDPRDEGLFVGGRTVTSNFPGASLVPGPPLRAASPSTDDVHYAFPSGKHGAPVVMVHGRINTRMTYETTPRRREGWGDISSKGAPYYVSITRDRGLGLRPDSVQPGARLGRRESRLAPHAAARHARARVVNFRSPFLVGGRPQPPSHGTSSAHRLRLAGTSRRKSGTRWR